MTVQEINQQHQRYVDLVARFKAARTFQQFLQGVGRIFVDTDLPRLDSIDLRAVGDRLKQVADHLADSAGERLESQMDAVEAELDRLTSRLLEEDSKVSASLHRLFFHRVRSYDQTILGRLLRFLLFAHQERGWVPDRLDKADFLASRMARELAPGRTEPDWAQVEELFERVTAGVERRAVADDRVRQTLRSLVEKAGEEAASADGVEGLRSVIASYRKLKHGVKPQLFDPGVLAAVARTDWILQGAVRRLIQREERGIFADSERILDLEGRVATDDRLDREIAGVRREIASFERRVQDDDVRLGDVSRLRERIASLIPRLDGGAPGPGEPEGVPPRAEPSEAGPPDAAEPSPGELAGEAGEAGAAGRPERPVGIDQEERFLRHDYRDLLEGLARAALDEPPESVSLDHDLAPFRLEPREVVAYRRLERGEGARDREELVLRAAALRRRLRREAEERREGLMAGGWSDGHAGARPAARLGADYADRLGRARDDAVLAGEGPEARRLQVLRVRLLREWSGLWLLLHRRDGEVDAPDQGGEDQGDEDQGDEEPR